MRKISANYIYSPNTGFLKNAILELDEEDRVLGLKASTGREEANTEFYNGILCPGFVNAHCHLELSHMKAKINEGLGLDRFIHSVVKNRKTEDKEILRAIENADREMQKEGIVAVGDISNKEDSFRVKSTSPIHYISFIEIFNMVNSQAESCFDMGKELLNIARTKYNLKAFMVPHAPYSVSEKLFEYFRKELDSPENLISVHSQESSFENEFISEKKGRLFDVYEKLGIEMGDNKARHINSLEYLIRSLPKSNPLLLVHNTHTGPDDIKSAGIDLSKTWFCLCPNSNLYISNELPSSFLAENYPENVCLGTDSLSSNHRLSILEEIKSLQNHFRSIHLNDLLRFATINGANALGLGHTAGSFEAGKKPGVNLIERADLQNLRLKKESLIKVLI